MVLHARGNLRERRSGTRALAPAREPPRGGLSAPPRLPVEASNSQGRALGQEKARRQGESAGDGKEGGTSRAGAT